MPDIAVGMPILETVWKINVKVEIYLFLLLYLSLFFSIYILLVTIEGYQDTLLSRRQPHAGDRLEDKR